MRGQRREWVLDAWVLARAADERAPDRDALELLDLIYRVCDTVLLDGWHGPVSSEYRRRALPRGAVARWLKRMVSSQNPVKVHCLTDVQVDEGHCKHLIGHLHFHDDDIPYLALASRASDRLLVAQESDYTQSVVAYVRNALGVTVVSVREAVAEIQPRTAQPGEPSGE